MHEIVNSHRRLRRHLNRQEDRFWISRCDLCQLWDQCIVHDNISACAIMTVTRLSPLESQLAIIRRHDSNHIVGELAMQISTCFVFPCTTPVEFLVPPTNSDILQKCLSCIEQLSSTCALSSAISKHKRAVHCRNPLTLVRSCLWSYCIFTRSYVMSLVIRGIA